MTDRPKRPGGRPPLQRRDPAEIQERLRHRDSGAIDARLRDHERTAASREKAILEARTRSRERPPVHEIRGGGIKPRTSRGSGRRRAIVLALLVSGLLIAAVVVPPLAGNLFRSMAENNPDLMRIGPIADAVGAVMDGRPDQPAGTDPTPIEFVITPGTGNRQIIDDLVEREIVTDRLALTYVLATEGGLDDLRAGTHVLNRTMSPREVAGVLKNVGGAPGTGIPIALRDGLRIEQVTAYLLTIDGLGFDPADFYDLAIDPPADLAAEYPMTAAKPDGASLEGFLGFGAFDIPTDTDAEAFLRLLLDRRQGELGQLIDAQPPEELDSFYDVLILASIVEREAALDQERSLIAGVFHNRLSGLEGGRRLLNSDSTVIYAKDTMALRNLPMIEWPNYVFWTFDGISNVGSFQVTDDLVGYHTWRTRGLPVGPIASASVASILAAFEPDTDDGYLYFLSKLDGSREHVFARTFEEHLHNIEIYLRGGTPTAAPSDLPTALPAP